MRSTGYAGAALALTVCAAAYAAEPSQGPKSPAPAPATASAKPDLANQPISNPQAIETAQPGGNDGPTSREVIARVEILLDRARFSPGEIDGKDGENVKKAVSAYKRSHNLPNPDAVDGNLLKALTTTDHAPVLQKYTITAEDEKGPFLGTVPKDFRALAKLKRAGYASAEEELGEKFHMSPALLHELNPGADLSKAGTTLTVAKPNDGTPPGQVARLQVDKTLEQVRAYDASGKMLAAYPATVGSTDRPAPSGNATVVSVAPDPVYTYDPKRVTFGPKSAGVLKIPPGPNNPVGSTWIALSVATYGIHGTPDPDLVSKTASHGCVRLTNWDAAALGQGVKKGTPVEFVGEEQPKGAQRT